MRETRPTSNYPSPSVRDKSPSPMLFGGVVQKIMNGKIDSVLISTPQPTVHLLCPVHFLSFSKKCIGWANAEKTPRCMGKFPEEVYIFDLNT